MISTHSTGAETGEQGDYGSYLIRKPVVTGKFPDVNHKPSASTSNNKMMCISFCSYGRLYSAFVSYSFTFVSSLSCFYIRYQVCCSWPRFTLATFSIAKKQVRDPER